MSHTVAMCSLIPSVLPHRLGLTYCLILASSSLSNILKDDARLIERIEDVLEYHFPVRILRMKGVVVLVGIGVLALQCGVRECLAFPSATFVETNDRDLFILKLA